MFSVSIPASDRSLLTVAELRGAVGVADHSSDAELQTLGDRVSAMIARYCSIPSDGEHAPTFLRETITETFRTGAPVPKLILQRTPVALINSITHNGEVLDTDAYEFRSASGLLFRLRDDVACYWHGKVIVDYVAGYVRAPDDLKLAAVKLARFFWITKDRDPLLKREEVPGVLVSEYWIGTIGENSIPPEVSDLLEPYRCRRA